MCDPSMDNTRHLTKANGILRYRSDIEFKGACTSNSDIHSFVAFSLHLVLDSGNETKVHSSLSPEGQVDSDNTTSVEQETPSRTDWAGNLHL